MFVFKAVIIFLSGLFLGLFSTWEYFLIFSVIFLFIAFLVDAEEDSNGAIYFIISFLLIIGFAIGVVISLKNPEDFPVITLLISIVWV